ncbi:MAG TPA: hypothetical protein VKB49_31035 [Candidatus Sulfotelmatobacter sp.]|nr:hypothetical protein [Candidatus Sulfotelmatobacter sp.]
MPNDHEPKLTVQDWIRYIIVVAAAATALICSLLVIRKEGDAMDKLKLATGYATLTFLFLLSIILLLDLASNKIDLSKMLEELSGGASLSRFQLLVFTFVIGFSFFVVVANSKENRLPDIPTNVLALLGVSASTYAVSKGLQISSGDVNPDSEGPQPNDTSSATPQNSGPSTPNTFSGGPSASTVASQADSNPTPTVNQGAATPERKS